MATVTGFRVSPQQAAWWRENQTQNGALTVCVELELREPVAEDQLRHRLRQLGADEEILRTRLEQVPGMALPIQVIDASSEIPLLTEDFSTFTEAEQAAWETSLTGRPLQVTLAKTGKGRDLLLLKGSAGHLDSHSLMLIGRRLLQGDVPHEALQYADYAEWKLSLLESEPDHAGRNFWRQIEREKSTPPLPGIPDVSAGTFQPRLIEIDTGIPLDVLRQRASLMGLGLDEFLFCAFSLLLGRLRGETQVRLMWIDAGRGEGLEEALGVYEQALPVLVEMNPALSLAKQRDDLLKHRRLGQGWSDYYDSTSSGDIYFAYRRFGSNPGTALKQAVSVSRGFALGLDCFEYAGEVRLRLAYNRTVVTDQVRLCLLEQWQLLLRGLTEVREPAEQDEPVGTIPLLGGFQSSILAARGLMPVIESVDVVSLIDARALNQPNSPALADANGTLTYTELAEHSNRLANLLSHSGVEPGNIVGILMPRGCMAIVAMLAVMKAGATYLPLDPTYPPERLAFMCRDSDLRLVITRGEHPALLSDDIPCLRLDQIEGGLEAWPNIAPPPQVDLNRTAYLIYTSGSTGQPKAVEISHGSLSHSTQVRMAFYAEPIKAYLMLSSFSFDSSVAGIYWTLAQGGLLVLPADREELDLASLAGLIRKYRISHSLSLPSLYDTLLDFAEPETFNSLATWIVAGEACAEQVLIKHRHKVPHARLVNEYGPTEATVWATADVLTDRTDTSITIGRPIPTVGLYLINEHAVPAALGEPGQIHVGGPGLASGYRNRPEATAQSFITLPHIARGERLYKTGDLARWRQDGRLDFLGRVDQQVKIRGYRVELGEIERQLKTCPQIGDVAVLAQETAGNQRLIAYVSLRSGCSADAQTLADYLSARLPGYMVPSAFVPLATLPRTPNGKLDRKALPDPDLSCAPTLGYIAPRNSMEIELAAICAEVLRRERVGVMDNFFQIGGDSILSLQIVARANQRGIRISARQVFECETVARMAEVASRTGDAAASPTGKRVEDSQSNPTQDLPLADLDEDAFASLLAELNVSD